MADMQPVDVSPNRCIGDAKAAVNGQALAISRLGIVGTGDAYSTFLQLGFVVAPEPSNTTIAFRLRLPSAELGLPRDADLAKPPSTWEYSACYSACSSRTPCDCSDDLSPARGDVFTGVVRLSGNANTGLRMGICLAAMGVPDLHPTMNRVELFGEEVFTPAP